ncbi:MAG TPA: dTDP-4-dehydrorhamnose 3,5-epimerase [Candidatus Angelobacter sp.]|nr:dTDP-4-dehydrorhamnose 3,5-epimerase [Candidatus Angelobacter sp.]
MPFSIESVHLNDVVVVAPQVNGDSRGFFMETFRADQFRALGLPTEFVQDNHSRSAKGVLRGLHFQWDPPMGKLMRVTQGSAFLVAVDIRKGSPTLGQWFGMEVSAENKKQIWAPYGFARGFCALTDGCEVQYKTTGIYNPKCEGGIYFADPAIGIRWPIEPATALTSERDKRAPTLAQWLESPLSDNIPYVPGLSQQEA